jgi:hypothetical protein
MTYAIDIEIDSDTGRVHIIKEDGREYDYSIEELAGKNLIDKMLDPSKVQLTVYPQNETFTLEEYKLYFGSDAI